MLLQRRLDQLDSAICFHPPFCQLVDKEKLITARKTKWYTVCLFSDYGNLSCVIFAKTLQKWRKPAKRGANKCLPRRKSFCAPPRVVPLFFEEESRAASKNSRGLRCMARCEAGNLYTTLSGPARIFRRCEKRLRGIMFHPENTTFFGVLSRWVLLPQGSCRHRHPLSPEVRLARRFSAGCNKVLLLC